MTHSLRDEDQAMADAGAWLARLQRHDLSEADGLEFEAWLAAAPENAAAYRRSLRLWQEFGTHAEAVLGDLTVAERRRVSRPSPSRRWLVGAGGFAMAAGLAAVFVVPMLSEPSIQTYATGKGQRQHVTLADGSGIDLNAETRISVRLTHQARQIILADGEAIFDVTHDARRPFTVATASHTVRVVGTQFDVRARDGDLAVTVAHGKVLVRPSEGASGGGAFLLTAGQRLAVDRAGGERLSAVDPQEAFGWRVGRLVYRAEPLSNVVADLNRQFVEQIEISDPELGRMPITGVIVLDDQPAVMARLSLMLPVRSIPSERGLLLLRK